MGSKALLAQSLAEADKLGGDKPMITLSVCPTPKRSQNTNNPKPGPSADANRYVRAMIQLLLIMYGLIYVHPGCILYVTNIIKILLIFHST